MATMPPYPITRAEISRSRLIENLAGLQRLARRTPGCELLAVVKADAYGHGACLCAPWLAEAGAEWLGVTSVQEGAAVRQVCPEPRILVMMGPYGQDVEQILDACLTPTVWDVAHLEALAGAARARSLPSGSIGVHLELDTGMCRQGVASGEALAAVLAALPAYPELSLEGVFTHFAAPEELDSQQTLAQQKNFVRALEQIAAAGFRPQWIHAGNSSSLLSQRHVAPVAEIAAGLGARLLVRPGIALYGHALPFTGEAMEMPLTLSPVMTWKTAIASLRTVEAGARIGYNGTFVAQRSMRLALLPVGYADGLNRKLSNLGHVTIRQRPAPIVGRVSMDLTIVDVSEIADASVGDEVLLLGGNSGITADDHARWAGTIPYEILCAVGARVPRVAVD